MTEIKKLWTAELPAFPAADISRIKEVSDGPFFEACACFWLFRCLHRAESAAAVLMGDYCFGRFSHHLSALDSVALTNAFSAFLKKDTLREAGLEDYLSFIRSASPLL